VRRRLFIPEEVKDSISTHLYTSTARAVEGYMSGNEDEDTLTGDLGATLRIGTQRVQVPPTREVGGTWTWSITYYKFRGRGKGATENYLGADGILELSVQWNDRDDDEKKCLLFQAKNQWQGTDSSLLEQCMKLSTWREAAFVLNYSPTDFEAYLLDDVIRSGGTKSQSIQAISLGAFLSRHYLECLVGDTDLRYDASSRRLIWRAMRGEMVATPFSLRHRISININPPKRGDIRIKGSREIPNGEIYNYRMKATEEEILSLESNYTQRDVQLARRRLAQVYHTDVNPGMDALFEELKKKRMQEVNNAYDFVYAKTKNKR
jgi:hypothetical protein